MTSRDRLHSLIDELPESSLERAERSLEMVVGCERVSLDGAPEDDEPLTAEDEIAIESAWRDREQGKLVGHADLLRHLSE
ncbi:MAG: hypothetical protein ACR2HN_13555 [Tepidiformaceae bacterium]